MGEQTEAGLARANAAFYAAFESLDLDRMAAEWARSVAVSCVQPGGDPMVGRREVVRAWRAIFEASDALRIQVEPTQVTVVGEAGWVLCRQTVHTRVQGQLAENALVAFNAFVWEEQRWRICHHQASPRIPGRGDRRPRERQTLH